MCRMCMDSPRKPWIMGITTMKGNNMYHVAILIEDGQWVETFGDHDKDCVDYEVMCWKVGDLRACGLQKVKRTAFKRVPTQAQLEAWVKTVA